MSSRTAFRARRGQYLSYSLRLLSKLPLPALHYLGTILGTILYYVPNPIKRIAACNIQLCFTDHSQQWRTQLLKAHLKDSARGALELGFLWCRPAQEVLSCIKQIDGEAAWQHALAQKKGGILMTPHLGAWEVSGLYASSQHTMTTLFRPSRLDIDEVIKAGRERLGAKSVPTNQTGVKALMQALKLKQVLGILPDQDPGVEGGIWAHFFGQPAMTMSLLSRLALKTQTPIFLLYAERLSCGQGYHLRFVPLPEMAWQGDIGHSVQAINDVVEAAIRQIPEQYLWSYKRFKSTPEGADSRYQLI